MLADRYQSEYGFKAIPVYNAPKIQLEIQYRPVDESQVHLIHHGAAIPDRRLDLMIETIAHTDSRFTLTMMLMDTGSGYLAQLKSLAERIAPGKVNFIPPVPPAEITEKISQFDIGLYLLPFSSFNNQASLPNKFFDFISAGLAICIGPSPEMARLSQKYGFGIISPTFDPLDVGRLLNTLTANQINQMKQSALAARNELNADVELAKVVRCCHEVLEMP